MKTSGWIYEAHFASFFLSEMVEMKTSSSIPYHGSSRHSKSMNKYEMVALFVILALFITLIIIVILNLTKTVPPKPDDPDELPHSGHVIDVKGKSQPAVDITGTQQTIASSDLSETEPETPPSGIGATSAGTPAPETPPSGIGATSAGTPAPETPPSGTGATSAGTPAPETPPSGTGATSAGAGAGTPPSKPSASLAPSTIIPPSNSSALPGDKIPDVKAIAASISKKNPLPIEETNDIPTETFYGKFISMR